MKYLKKIGLIIKGVFWRLEYKDGCYILEARGWLMLVFTIIISPFLIASFLITKVQGLMYAKDMKIRVEKTNEKRLLRNYKEQLLQ